MKDPSKKSPQSDRGKPLTRKQLSAELDDIDRLIERAEVVVKASGKNIRNTRKLIEDIKRRRRAT